MLSWKKNGRIFKIGKRLVWCNDCTHSWRFTTQWTRRSGSKIVRSFKQISHSRSHNAFSIIPSVECSSCWPRWFNLYLQPLLKTYETYDWNDLILRPGFRPRLRSGFRPRLRPRLRFAWIFFCTSSFFSSLLSFSTATTHHCVLTL